MLLGKKERKTHPTRFEIYVVSTIEPNLTVVSEKIEFTALSVVSIVKTT